jgi:DNA-binding transcriptional LysR family regulator
MDAVLQLAAAGLGAAVVPRMVLERQADLVGLPFTRPQLTRTLATAYRRDVALTSPAAALQMLLREDVDRQYAPRDAARTSPNR